MAHHGTTVPPIPTLPQPPRLPHLPTLSNPSIVSSLQSLHPFDPLLVILVILRRLRLLPFLRILARPQKNTASPRASSEGENGTDRSKARCEVAKSRATVALEPLAACSQAKWLPLS